ncbi:hypothetical protein [Stagnimonas aquatica]|uniref:hypothetical protein n=1 Tax=Stagnimonas aquatica TaxID=2689987 RepID=UPI0011CDA147|nr:hypothetical protein [Stagnimonas aquatica]
MKKHLVFVIALSAGLISCATNRASETDPHAEILLKRNNLGGISNTVFFTCGDDECIDKNKTDRLFVFSWATADEKNILIPVNKPFPLFATSGRVTGATNTTGTPGVYQLTGVSCADLIQFMPQAGKRYEVVQTNAFPNCPVAVRDAATNEIVPTKSLPIKGSAFGVQ